MKHFIRKLFGVYAVADLFAAELEELKLSNRLLTERVDLLLKHTHHLERALNTLTKWFAGQLPRPSMVFVDKPMTKEDVRRHDDN